MHTQEVINLEYPTFAGILRIAHRIPQEVINLAKCQGHVCPKCGRTFRFIKLNRTPCSNAKTPFAAPKPGDMICDSCYGMETHSNLVEFISPFEVWVETVREQENAE